MKTHSMTTDSAGQAHASKPFFASKDQPAAPFFGASLVQRKLQEAQDSPSSSLDAETRPALETFLNQDLSHVKVHNNTASHEASSHIQAKAYTTGNHIFMGSGTDSMSPIQRKALLAHEVVHTIQQKSITPGTIQAKPEIGDANSSYEAEADTIAHAFVQSQAAGSHSAGALLRSPLSISAVSKSTIQRVKTWGGDWSTEAYKKVSPEKPGGILGAHIKIKFKPNANVNAELIGLTQTAKAIKSGIPWYIGDATRKSHGITSKDAKEVDSKTKETDEAAHIDRIGPRNNPIYGSVGLTGKQNLGDTPMNNNTSGKPLKLGVNATYELGYHYYAGKTLKKQDARMFDEPVQTGVDKNSSNIFEVTALCLKGAQQGTYYGSVRWGWRTNAKGKHTLIPFSVVSQGVPSSSFMKAAEMWNAGKDSGGNATADLPIVHVKKLTQPMSLFLGVPYRNITLPAGTRVQQLFDWRHWNQIKIRVVDGKHTGKEGHVNFWEWSAFAGNDR